MKLSFSVLLFFFLLSLSLVSCKNQAPEASPWPKISQEAKPWARWWWLGSEVDKENIVSQLEKYSDAGFGGLEITPIYGVKGHEKFCLDFLSPEWMDMLELSIEEAGRLGMGMDMNLGTGWPFGGPQITPSLAAGKLILQNYQLAAGQKLDVKIQPEEADDRRKGLTLEALMAYSEDGKVLDLTGQVNENSLLLWVPDQGTWDLVAAFSGKTGQIVKRSAPGGEGFTMDHFSEKALQVYLERFDRAFEGKKMVRAFFNDSYEVYNASWTPGLFEEFQSRRGYDLRNHLSVFIGKTNPDLAAKVKSDYRQTLAELLLENFTQPLTSWSNQKGSLTRNQAHGSPGNLIDLYAAVDIPECEIFGHRNYEIPGARINKDDSRNVEPNPMMLKLATSAAHVSNKKLISNETFTWLGEHFKVALSQCKPEVEDAFLAGINHVFYHGIPYSPASEPWPGWLFYASVHFGPSNTFWDHLTPMNQYISRCQSILQSGSADNEVLVYWPIFDIWDEAEGQEMQLGVHNIQEWLVYPEIDHLAEQGYSYDFISDALLQGAKSSEGDIKTTPGAPAYKVLVIPACEIMPVTTLKKILDIAGEGSLVVFESLPVDVPGYHEHDQRRKILKELLGELQFEVAGQGIRKCKLGEGTVLQSSDLSKALEYAGIGREHISNLGLKFTRRNMEDGKYYYLVNHSPSSIDTLVPLNAAARSVLIMDPQDGSFGSATMETEGLQTRVRVQLQSGESIFLRLYDKITSPADPWEYELERLQPIELAGTWHLSFLYGGPALPKPRKLDTLKLWTELSDPGILDFSGTAEYTITFNKPKITADRFLLDPGEIHESARILLNGKEIGYAWSFPMEIDLGSSLKEGENTLSLQVANLMANRIIYMDRQGITWRNFKEINFVNISYKPFDASGWEPEPSGLAGPVWLIPVELE